MRDSGITSSMRWMFAVLLTLCPLFVAANNAGRFQFVNGDVSILAINGQKRLAQKGGLLVEGETIVTGRNGSAQVLMSDSGIVAVRPDTQLKIETYRYSGKNDGSEQGVLGLIKGGFRAITGLIGRFNKDAYSIKTPNATIGIRGTDHEPFYIPPPAPGEVPIGQPGTYDVVNQGEVFIQTGAGLVELAANQIGFAPGQPGAIPLRLKQAPAFLRPTPEVRRDAANQRRGGPGGSGQQPRQQSPQATAPGESPPPEGGDQSPEAAPLQPPPPGPEPISGGPIAEGPVGISPIGNTSLNPLPPPPRQQGTLDPRFVSASLTPAPIGMAIAGGDLSPGGFIGSGAGIVGIDSAVLLDANQLPVEVGNGNGFNYQRLNAPLVSSGSATVGTALIKWGVYEGGVIRDQMGERFPRFMHFTGGGTAMTFTSLQNVLSNSISFSTVAGFSQPVAETGLINGHVSLSVTLKNVSGLPAITSYGLSVSDSTNGRSWSAGLTGPQRLVDFVRGGPGSNLSVSCSGCPVSTGNGRASGVVIGTATTPQGMISSYDLHAGSAAVGGGVVVK